ncbi:DUF4166 domain-containing protein [Variovorax sp. J22R24]|uniref:DUF4166 domain-containing protein n=1 Tax=Variovorax gracilis TaxID=3053502 RepID=UPI002577053D|nr:DUF4166 domain-containing protein [Variovorax sp. J22R24]MDM0109706.1 DUF4166 domain-containing protein [Variovorax sp. J22R24]
MKTASTSMYEQAMGESFDRLQVAVRRFHRLAGSQELHGWVDTDAPSTLPARILARCLGTPLRATSGPIRFELHAGPEAETWTRHFPAQRMTSRMSLDAGQLVEQLGAARLNFDLCEADGRLEMRLKALHFLGVPCPNWLLPHVIAEETGQRDRLHFRVQASLPFIGTVTSYRGHLTIGERESL